MSEANCDQCGRLLVQTRVGRQKRFCDAGCRVAWHQGRARTGASVSPLQRKAPAEAGPSSRAGRIATLEWLHGELERDVRARGAVVDGKPHPGIELMRKITNDLARMTPAALVEEPVVVAPTSLKLI